MAKFRFLTTAQQMAVSSSATTCVAEDFEDICNVLGTEGYTFVPFSSQPVITGWEIRESLTNDGEVIRRGRARDTKGRAISVRLWDRALPIPEACPVDRLEFGTARQGNEVIYDIVETERGAVKVPRVYARLKTEKAE